MKRKIILLAGLVVSLSILSVLYYVKLKTNVERVTNKSSLQGDLIKTPGIDKQKFVTEDNVNNTQGVVLNNVKSQSDQIDNKQLSVSSVKEIDIKGIEYTWGWYGTDSVITANNISSTNLIVKNLITGSKREINIVDNSNIIDYKDKKLLIDSEGYFLIYNLESGKKLKIVKSSSAKIIPKFIGAKGKFILTDNGKNFLIVNSSTGEKVVIKSALLKDYCKGGPQGFPEVIIDADKNIFYFTKENAIYKSYLNNSNKSTILARIPSAKLINSLAFIKEEKVLIVNYYVSADYNAGKVSTINLLNGSISSLGNISMGSTSDSSKVNMKNESLNRMIYEEKATKTGITQIYISELKGNKFTKTKNILSKQFSVNSGQWQAMWNEDGTRVFVSIYSRNGTGYKYYLINLGR